jgi:phosphopantothenoylcysteine synthetase/decarboxylase
VRFLSNYSTGELGFLLCKKLKESGMNVIAVVGPTSYDFHNLQLRALTEVETPEEMKRAVLRACKTHRPDYGVFAAAVLDFVPARRKSGKVTSSKTWKITLVPTPKIIDAVDRVRPRMKKIGFKLEAKRLSGQRLKNFAEKKMQEKRLSGLCVNFFSEISRKGHFASCFDSNGKMYRATTKASIAQWIARQIVTHAS